MAEQVFKKTKPAFDIRPLTPSLGAEISGIDINRIDAQTLAQIRACWLQYKVIFIREQKIDLDDLCRFSQGFGELMQLPYIKPAEGFPKVIRVLKEADEINMGVFGGDWHSDFSFLAEPPMASILYGNDIPPLGGDTLWVNMAQAWKDLPEDLRQQLKGKIAIHIGAPYGVSHAPEESTQFKGSIEIARNNPEADEETRHPAVCRHPDTGEEMLFISPTYTTRIDGFSEPESDTLLNKLYQHCTRPEFSCRFNWQAGTLAIWDNRNTMHYAVNDYDGFRREMFRTTIKGHAPIPA
jgi:taurine dioxygenase